MPRPQRIQVAGFYHLTTRGNRSGPIVADYSDRESFFSIAGSVVRRHDWECIAYCLMTNHYHFVPRTHQEDLGCAMERLNGLYARTFNARHGLQGHVFERRYSSRFIREEAHLMEVIRYVALNPVRAGICRRPEEYPWSSYAAALGLTEAPAFFNPALVLRYFNDDPAELRSFVEARLLPGWPGS